MNDGKTAATRLQDNRISQALNALDDRKDVVIFAPTGAGKSRLFSVIAEDRAQIGERTLVLTNRKRLVTQARENMEKWGSQPVLMSIGMDGLIDLSGQVVYSTVQTAHQHRDRLGVIDNVIIDEMHNAATRNEDFTETLHAIRTRNPDMLMIGATATPPEEYQGMDERFAKAAKVVITYDEAIAARLIELPETFIPQMRHETHETVESVVERFRKKGGGYEAGLGSAVKALRGEDWNDQLLDLYERKMKDDQTIIFFDSIGEAASFSKEAKNRGLEMALVTSDNGTRANNMLMDAFNEGKIPAMIAVDMISEGVDTRATCILNNKVKTSPREFQQINGRAARSYGERRERRGRLYDTGTSPYLHGDIGAIAAVSTFRGERERNSLGDADMLPGALRGGFDPWTRLETPQGREVHATVLDDKIVYAADIGGRYAAFVVQEDKKGRRMDMLAIEGERKGTPTPEGFGRWLKQANDRNEQIHKRLLRALPEGGNGFTSKIGKDWSKNAAGVHSSIETIIKFTAPAPAIAAKTSQRAIGV